jgi:hypothetical protein
MNLYNVEYELVSPSSTKEEYDYLPTHIVARNQSNALETAVNYQSINFQLKRVYLAVEKVNIVRESLS